MPRCPYYKTVQRMPPTPPFFFIWTSFFLYHWGACHYYIAHYYKQEWLHVCVQYAFFHLNNYPLVLLYLPYWHKCRSISLSLTGQKFNLLVYLASSLPSYVQLQYVKQVPDIAGMTLLATERAKWHVYTTLLIAHLQAPQTACIHNQT